MIRAQSAIVLMSLFCVGSVVADPRRTSAEAGDPPAGSSADSSAQADTSVYELPPVEVTATRTPRPVFLTPSPVSVLDQTSILESSPANITDLFTTLPGTDVNGMGSNQRRPTIRGHRGQRILLLEDGLRLNNARRQQDFGELPAIVDPSAVKRVEVVRGPGSVLYGSDAIGGVVNIITQGPLQEGVHGSVGYRYGTEGVQNGGRANIEARSGKWSIEASGTLRESGSTAAPSGSYGDIHLNEDTMVHDTGIQDESTSLRGGYQINDGTNVWAKFERYQADTAGFGYVDPQDYAPEQPFVRILYPNQEFQKVTVGTQSSMDRAFADRMDVSGYFQNNERNFDLHVLVSAGPGQIATDTYNFTDLETYGGRAEASKGLGSSHRLTYGLDFFRDVSENTDSSSTLVTGFGPPQQETSNVPLVPNASYQSWGAFAQDEWNVGTRSTLIFGVRGQQVTAKTRETEGIDDPEFESDDATVVGSVNGLVRVTDDVAAIASVGRAFRSPNLVERFFNGPTPEGFGFQKRNLDLDPETSIDSNLGLRFRNGRISAEVFGFYTEIQDGIRIAATGDSVSGMPAFQNVNVDELVHTGTEISAEARVVQNFHAGANWSYLNAENQEDSSPVGEGYESKLTGWVGYRDQKERFWTEYHVRYVNEREDVQLGSNPVGESLPSFLVHSVRAGARLPRVFGLDQRFGASVENLTNELYAEFANVSFFRPEPRRNFVAWWETRF
jgi:outer membrane receptor protein involved in Fe transport